MGREHAHRWPIAILAALLLLALAFLAGQRTREVPAIETPSGRPESIQQGGDDLLALEAPEPGASRVSRSAPESSIPGGEVSDAPDPSTDAPIEDEQETGSVLLRVVDEKGARLPSIGVIIATPGDWGSYRYSRKGLTDAIGEYQVDSFPAGRILGRVDVFSLPEGHMQPEDVHGILEAGRSATLTLVSPLAGGIVGQVLHADLTPVPHVRVHLSSKGPSKAKSLSLKSDHEGRFESGPVHPGHWWVSPWPDSGRAYLGGATPPGQWIDVLPGQPTQARLVAPSTGVFIRGRVIDQEGAPVQGLRVSAHRLRIQENAVEVNPRSHGVGLAFTETDASGAYEVGPLTPDAFVNGRVVVRVAQTHGTSSVTADAVLLADFPEPMLVQASEEPLTTVERVADAREWLVQLRLGSGLAAQGTGLRDFRYSVGYCALDVDEEGRLRFRADPLKTKLTLTIGRGSDSWKRKLVAPPGDLAVFEITVPK